MGKHSPEPVTLTVDAVFEYLDAALDDAIEKSGNRAKSVAWDVRGYFLGKIGHYRTAHRASPEPGHMGEDG